MRGACNDLRTLRKITKICSNMLHYNEVTVSSIDELSWKLIRKLTSPFTSSDAIRYFTEHTGKEIHPCIIAEIVLTWWSAKGNVCSDIRFIERLFSSIQDIDSYWIYDVTSYSNCKDLVKTLRLRKAAVERYFYYRCNNNLSELIECIQTGDGTPLLLPKEAIFCTDDMTAYKERVPVFRYYSAVVPPYCLHDGHWYLVCAYKNEGVTKCNFIAFVTDSQKEIVSYLDSCDGAGLLFVPPPEPDRDSR